MNDNEIYSSLISYKTGLQKCKANLHVALQNLHSQSLTRNQAIRPNPEHDFDEKDPKQWQPILSAEQSYIVQIEWRSAQRRQLQTLQRLIDTANLPQLKQIAKSKLSRLDSLLNLCGNTLRDILNRTKS